MIDQLMDWSHACGLPITDAIKAPLAFLFEDKAYSSSSIVKDKATSEPIRYSHLTRSTLRFHCQSHSAESQNTKCSSVLGSREGASVWRPLERWQESCCWVRLVPNLHHMILVLPLKSSVVFYGSAGKSGMYFVEDNVAETHDNQVCVLFPKRLEVCSAWTIWSFVFCPSSSK